MRRAAWSAAVRLGLEVYDPRVGMSYRLDEAAEEVLDDRSIADRRPSTTWEDVPDLTLVPKAPPGVIDVERFRGARVLEVGPKYGVHSLWIDLTLEPSELVFSDFAADSELHDRWGGSMLLESTVDSRSDAIVRLNWHASTGKAVPTVAAMRTELAWTRWRKVRRFTDYRPESSAVLLLCEKTDELAKTTGLAPVVTAHRRETP